ncbi:hypothetical protein Ngar_c13790 [Candidatus Nitrososphaera gargensis Ga9.2]|uniref:Uncharacterized protein n=1 Tax=Nitrososphaera gargensis (strain Ga9.2) TaxID=1237085 RepID=K0IAH6_NITGG|nr:hypothetical protein [Candidatus Nitrososphaera gargensis]AFU58316.1 hypothetical protein Ngar_c13790 [Candidatus Nitrososphaera gargensis Ga9.2]
MVHKNFKRQRRLESRLDETVRIASIVQKGMATGRSSYVEMRALDRLIKHNIRTRVSALKKSVKLSVELDELLSKIPQAVSDGYTKVLTPNGIVREGELDHLLSIDADIVMCIGMFESEKSRRGVVETLKELVEERKKLIDSLKV